MTLTTITLPLSTRLGLTATGLALAVSGLASCDSAGNEATAKPPPSPTPSTAIAPIDTTTWTTYSSSQYDFKVGHPPDWSEVPASRDWTWETDATAAIGPALDDFRSPDGTVRVSVWSVPLDRDERVNESIPYIEAWVEDYCVRSHNTPCSGIDDRGVDLCLERRDCHPGLLVPFKEDVQAFFSAGIYDPTAMIVAAVWRPESGESVAPYGGSRRLLEAFLSTMEVWPASTLSATAEN